MSCFIEVFLDLKKLRLDGFTIDPLDVSLQGPMGTLRELLGRRFTGLVYATFGGQTPDADAILNQAAFAILSAVDRFEGSTEGQAVEYAYKAVRSRCLDEMRRGLFFAVRSGRHAGSASEEEDGIPDPIGNLPAPGGPLEDEVDRQRVILAVREVLESLRPIDREALLLLRNEAQVRAAAERLGIRENTLTVRIKRAKQRFAKRLNKVLASASAGSRSLAKRAPKKKVSV